MKDGIQTLPQHQVGVSNMNIYTLVCVSNIHTNSLCGVTMCENQAALKHMWSKFLSARTLRNFYDLRVPISYKIWQEIGTLAICNTAWGSKKLESGEKSEPQFLYQVS
jgi:hypothetical protein